MFVFIYLMVSVESSKGNQIERYPNQPKVTLETKPLTNTCQNKGNQSWRINFV